MNIGTASPGEFVGAFVSGGLPSGWEERSAFIAREGQLTFRHFDFYSQALAKLERGHERDLADVQAMRQRELVDPDRLLALFEEIEPQLYLFPAISPERFRERVEQVALNGRSDLREVRVPLRRPRAQPELADEVGGDGARRRVRPLAAQ